MERAVVEAILHSIFPAGLEGMEDHFLKSRSAGVENWCRNALFPHCIITSCTRVCVASLNLHMSPLKYVDNNQCQHMRYRFKYNVTRK